MVNEQQDEIYFDNASTTYVYPEVIETISNSLKEDWHNPSSPYSSSVRTKEKIETVRSKIAEYINCSSSEVYFTSSGSEGNNMLLNLKDNTTLLIDCTSHKSAYIHKGKIRLLKVDLFGNIDLNYLYKVLKETTLKNDINNYIVVSINGGNNEIGTIQNIDKISEVVHKFPRTFLHVDAVQLFPFYRIDVKKRKIDAMTVSGHKIHAPAGIGFAYMSDEYYEKVIKSPLIEGTQENHKRGGTENTTYILALGKAIEMIDTGTGRLMTLILMRDYFLNKLLQIEGTYLIGETKNRLPNHICVCFQGIEATSLIYYLDNYGICVSGGSACNSHSLSPSHVLECIGLPYKDLHSCIRFTLSEENTIEEINKTVSLIKQFITIYGKESK